MQVRYIPHGRGTETTTNYQFSGVYQLGKRKSGRLAWTSNNFENVYEGNFD